MKTTYDFLIFLLCLAQYLDITSAQGSGGACSYSDALHKSVLFFEAQRSGYLPADNRISWRGDSALSDGDSEGVDLEGGYYTNFGFMKNTFPLSFTSTIISWGVIQWSEQYQQSGEYDTVLDAIKWGLDFLMKCRVGTTYYAQVGDMPNDYSTWGRPEDIDDKVASTSWDKWLRPAMSVDLTSQGTDVAAQVSAAMSSGYMVFKDEDPTYAATLLNEAKLMFNHAYDNPSKKVYSATIHNAGGVYGSNWSYDDDLCWAALWLYYATDEDIYLTKAEETYKNWASDAFFFSDVKPGHQLLMYMLTGDNGAKTAVETFLLKWFPGTAQIPYTPKGLAHGPNIFPLSNTANVAFLALMAAELNIMPTIGREFASNQIGYMLGSTGLSFVVGCGPNYPDKIKHKASSCPSLPDVCDWTTFNTMQSNPNVLEGALIGGPRIDDTLPDSQNSNERLVALDYNAGFQSALVGLMASGNVGVTIPTQSSTASTSTETTSPNEPTTTSKGTTTTSTESSTTSTESTTTSTQSSTTSTQAATTTTPTTTTKSTTISTQTPTATSSSSSETTPSVSTCATSGTYNYAEVLEKSILFYEAQRSGYLPQSNRIPFRKDSATGDQGDNGEDLTGGWYDAGDHVKFGFPMAYSVATLAWGLIVFKDGYEAAGQYQIMLDSIKWPLDYFIKCHVSDNKFYGQVGNGGSDHAFWGRPEDMTMARPAYYIDLNKKGADLAGLTAAAMAAGAIVFKDQDSSYSQLLLDHAEKLFQLAIASGDSRYSNAIPDAGSYYSSSHAYDDVAWGALWLYKATNDISYLNTAKSLYNQHNLGSTPWAFDWDSKHVAVQLMLYGIEGDSSYRNSVESFLYSWSQNGGITYTPKGLAWRIQWGSLRYAANTALIALIAASEGINPTQNQNWARSQIHYMLGDTGRSFVCGFGNNPPVNPHHRSSSCSSDPNVPCDWNFYWSNLSNANILYGALVGGPGQSDDYQDDRTNFENNEVACDYNAGFQGAIAGLISLQC